MTNTGPAAIALHGLTRTFQAADGPVAAVDGIDLVVRPGEVVALLGPNGAGKTTTLDMVLGLSEPTSGTVNVLGRPPRQAVREGRVSAVLQTGGLLADLRVGETVELVASLFESHATVADVMERAGIVRLADRKVSKCSGGEQQRLRFALALLPEPDLLILDEPTAGMDVSARREFWAAMHTEAGTGRTVVFATHYLEEADDFADRIVLISGGRVVADGPTEQIRAMATGRTASFDVAPSEAEAARRRLGAEPAVTAVTASESGPATRLTVRSTDADLVARLALVDLAGRNLEVVSGSLEEAFLTLTDTSARTDKETAL